MPQMTPVPVWPRIQATTRPDGSGELTINGTSHAIETTHLEDARATILERVADIAAKLGRPVRLATTGPEGDWPLIVHPNGTVEEDPDGTPRPRAVEEPTRIAEDTAPPVPVVPRLVRPALTGVEKILARIEAERAGAPVQTCEN
ncbi:hypothetical protein [Antribacter gilvus]|uniref:hypothetical protein n=1 Tax=Antribacter gilvus TaxID=2304675 RepID=UPI000F779E2E|nr:hypothetical protein [Antribacter gilvus]